MRPSGKLPALAATPVLLGATLNVVIPAAGFGGIRQAMTIRWDSDST